MTIENVPSEFVGATRYTLLADKTIVADYDIAVAPRAAWLQSWWCMRVGCHADVDVPCPCGRSPILPQELAIDPDERIAADITLKPNEQVLLIEACTFMRRHYLEQGDKKKATKFMALHARIFGLGD